MPKKDAAPAAAAAAADEDEGDENIVYVAKGHLEQLRKSLENGEAPSMEELGKLSSPRKAEPEETVVPIDLRAMDKVFGDDEEDIVGQDMSIDVARMIKKLGAKGAAQAFLDAQKCFEKHAAKMPEDDRPEPMTAREWVEGVEEGSDLEGLELPEGGESELEDEEEEEVELDGDLEWDEGGEGGEGGEAEPPSAKKRKKA